MTTQAKRSKSQAGSERRFHNAQGAEVKTRDEAFAAQRDLSAEAVSTDAKLELHNGAVTFAIEVQYNPNTYPHVVTGGKISSGICGAPWDLTGGFIGETIRLDAKRTGQGSCATTITIVGEFQNPSAYRGTYGFDGASSSFKHTTRYQC
ncbi:MULTISPECIES: hypothetical protein [unclassified Streptomyces]|uniref:hypothetical protein n=1 Tax=unclassified Streptomyces TaxID=2593676 RepID=UPI0022524294|nr:MULTISPECIES: hypothetical protein [unclassified Streptomyces]MCX4975501.1 hypothetical protein [Streptomyces sp. NBC_00620]WTB42019.1 hypothetical protein OG569_30525 [Streptomyces sp. NBC_00827]WUC10326.1 hypothetical protein OG256_10715 [Streptomyces sp. NBC_00564]WUC53149.1 hypothetical protein OG266_34240 [Streptomyces sp. NBC_00554]